MVQMISVYGTKTVALGTRKIKNSLNFSASKFSQNLVSVKPAYYLVRK